jgi:hypothetical protein
MRSVVIIGTSHAYQISRHQKADAFRSFVEGICSQYSIAAIGEELSREALTQKDCALSICQMIASSRELAHRFCDPDNAQRITLDIANEKDIRWKSFACDWDENRTQQEISLAYDRREHFWLDQLIHLNIWPVLFVCGANHVDNFHKLLKACKISALTVETDWSPENFGRSRTR